MHQICGTFCVCRYQQFCTLMADSLCESRTAVREWECWQSKFVNCCYTLSWKGLILIRSAVWSCSTETCRKVRLALAMPLWKQLSHFIAEHRVARMTVSVACHNRFQFYLFECNFIKRFLLQECSRAQLATCFVRCQQSVLYGRENDQGKVTYNYIYFQQKLLWRIFSSFCCHLKMAGLDGLDYTANLDPIYTGLVTMVQVLYLLEISCHGWVFIILYGEV